MAELIKKYVGAYTVEIGKFYNLVLFNFLFSNGDTHLKNFALLETENGDYILSPAYDLFNTRIHVGDTFFALKDGLFKDEPTGIPAKNDFLEFGKRIGIKEKRRNRLFADLLNHRNEVYDLINRSFLDDKTKRAYTLGYNERWNMMSK